MPPKQKHCHYKNIFLLVVSFPFSFLRASPPGKSLSLILVLQLYFLTFVLLLPRGTNGLPSENNNGGKKDWKGRDPLEVDSEELPPGQSGPGFSTESTTKRGPRQFAEVPMTRKEAIRIYRSQNAFIRTCGYDGDFGVDAMQCSKGVTVKEAFIPGCICLRGIWVIHSKLCTNAPIVLIGRHKNKHFDCYSVDFEVRSFLFLGNPEDPFEPHNYVAPRTMTVFYEIPQNGDWTSVLDFEDPVIIAINPKPGTKFEAEDTGDCFSRVGVDSTPNDTKIHVWSTALQSTRFRKVDKCTNPERIAYQSIGTHDSFYYHGNHQFPLPVESCIHPCPIWPDFNTTDTPEKIFYADDIRRIFYHEWVKIFEETTEKRQERLRKKKEEDAEFAAMGLDLKKVMKDAAIRANSLDGTKNEKGEIDRSPKFSFSISWGTPQNEVNNTTSNETTPENLNQSETNGFKKSQPADENSNSTASQTETDNATFAGPGVFENTSTSPRPFFFSSPSSAFLNSEAKSTQKPGEWSSNSTMGPQNLDVDLKQRRKRKSRRRKKRKVIVCEVVWRGRGSCLHSYWDPIDKFEMSEKDQQNCFPSLDAQPRPKLTKFG